MGAVDRVPNVSGPMGADPDYAPRRDRSARPWALILAVLILVGVEAALRLSGWPKRIPYELDLDEYFAVAAAIEKSPMPDIVVVGSSRAREAVDLPRFREQLKSATGREWSIANFAVSGGRAYVIDAITERLLREPVLPKLILLGGAERDLSYDPAMYDQASLYWDFHDWLDAWHARGSEVLGELPVVVRNRLGDVWKTLGYREQLRLAASHWLKRERGTDGPIAGGLTVWQINNSRRSIARSPAGDVKSYARSISRQFPSRPMLDAMTRLAAACEQKHVPLVIFQVPIPHILAANLPKGMETTYADAIGAICSEHNARFIVASDLSAGLSDKTFRDTSHLNITGADLVGETLAEKIAQFKLLPTSTPQSTTTP